MDVSSILGSYVQKHQNGHNLSDDHFQLDPGYLTVTDTNQIDVELENDELESYIEKNARDATQKLFGALFSLPTTASPDGPLAILPPPAYELPRAKPLPKAKEPTKWERFAAAKGIQKKKRDKKIWDEEKQEWVSRWGWKGKNKEIETQWLHEVPANADIDHDPRKVAKAQRKERVAKNEKQKLQNQARATGSSSSVPPTLNDRKRDLDRTLATTRVSTASMGKFDRQLEGEKKPHGLKRKFDPTETSADQERKNALDLVSRMESDTKKMRKEPAPSDEGVLNVRKAIRSHSKGQGGVALAKKLGSSKGNKSRR